MIASDRMLRWLCWSLIVFVIISALLTLTLSLNPFGTYVDDTVVTDYVDRLLIFRGNDQLVYGLVLIGSLASLMVYAIAAALGPALRRLAGGSAATDLLAVVFIVGGGVGVAAQLANIGVGQAATNGYCDCGYKAYEVISQAYALDIGWAVVFWLNLGAVSIVGIGAALTGWLVNLSRDFKIVSYLIALFLLVAVGLRFFGVFQLSDQVVGLTAGIGVPIWAFLLARGSVKLAAQT